MKVFPVFDIARPRRFIHNAIAVDDRTRAEIEAWGRPRWLLVPNGWHRLDAGAFAARYDDLEVLCPSGSRKKYGRNPGKKLRWKPSSSRIQHGP